MKSIIALVLLVACAAQVHSACVNTNNLCKDYRFPARFGFYNNHYYDSLDWYPQDVVTYRAQHPVRSCSCGSCPTCRSAFHHSYPSFALH